MTLSTWSSVSIEDVAAANGDGLRWFQLIIYPDKDLTYQLVKQAEQSGYQAIVLTVDMPTVGKRRELARHNFSLPPNINLAILKEAVGSSMSSEEIIDLSLNLTPVTWKSVDWLRSVTSLPIVLKGILTKEEATIALQHNVQGIQISNHGGRQFDGVQATVSYSDEEDSNHHLSILFNS